ncbi:RidA family protein [Luteitalea sp.]|uniref:RidA family protein n=1 Tax=Luteitalea sp. TaxID=2004800 RepID=UPI0037CBC170
MAEPRSSSSRRPSRRAAMTAGLATLAGTGAPVRAAQSSSAQVPGWGPRKVAITRKDRKAPNPLLSHAVRSGPLVFLAGIGGWYPEDRPDPGDARVQTDSALRAMKMILEQAGSSMANVLKVHMTIADPNRNLPLVNEGYRGHFPDPPPARSYSGCGVNEQGRDHVLIQIDCIALVE